MKTVLMFALLVLGSNASASWFQENCSNAQGTVKTASGHNDNSITLTESTFTADGREISKKIDVDLSSVVQVASSEKELFSKVQSGKCQSGDSSTFYGSQKVTYQRLVLRQVDDRLFSKNIVGVSKDRKTVTAHLICDRQVANEMPCN